VTNEQRLFGIVAAQSGKHKDDVSLDSRFLEDLGCDRLDVMHVVIDIEDQFKIAITDDQADAIATVRDAGLLIDRLTAVEATPDV
jgi:acyl carrier protein